MDLKEYEEIGTSNIVDVVLDLTGDSDIDDNDENDKTGDNDDNATEDLTSNNYEPDDVDDEQEQDYKIEYLAVPFGEKDQVKSLGAWWNKDNKKWAITYKNDSTRETFERWLIDESIYPNEVLLDIPNEHKFNAKSIGAINNSNKWTCPRGINPDLFEEYHAVYLNVPFEQKNEAKEKGVKFDSDEKKWYVMRSKINLFQKWTQPSTLQKRKREENSTYEENPSYPQIMDIGRNVLIGEMKSAGCPNGYCFEYWEYGVCGMRDGAAKIGCKYNHVINLNRHY